MQKNELLKSEAQIIRVLEIVDEKAFVIDCLKRTMPKWKPISSLISFKTCTLQELLSVSDLTITEYESLDNESRRVTHQRFTMIAGILPSVSDENQRNRIISVISEQFGVSKQTLRNYLCRYLVFQNISVLAPKQRQVERELTQDEKNMRWALNKFFYTRNKNSLNEAYTFLIKEKYRDSDGKLLSQYPSFYQFRYFYRKHRKWQTFYISRDGIKSYQRNNRPLTGDGVQEYMPFVGMAMLDATVCDIYLVNEAGELIGRPILTAAIDGYSSLCVGYSLQWEGGIYSVKSLVKNIMADKQEWCKSRGIMIDKTSWDINKLPAVIITDAGSEYRSQTLEQISELGVTVINLPSFRPELKGPVEKFFDLIQDSYKPYLKGKGIIEPDFQERGVHDYRKDACLTMKEFERILIRCIIYYNSKRIIKNYPYTAEMITANVKPYANNIFDWGCKQSSLNLIDVDYRTVMLTLLPRTVGLFSRKGLKVNKMRYHADGYTERYLSGTRVTVAFNPDDSSSVWLLENGNYTKFSLIESRYQSLSLDCVQSMQKKQRELVKNEKENNLQSKIDLAEHIQTVVDTTKRKPTVSIKSIRKNRAKELMRNHEDFLKEGVEDD